MDLTPVERYLVGFHDTNPGVTSRAFDRLPVASGEQAFESTYHALVAALPQTATPSTILDVACGDGHLLAVIAEAAPHSTLIGIDLSAGELASARARLGKRAALLRGKAQQLPLASGSVDVVTSHMALMLMDDAERVVAELRRMLRPAGMLAVVVGARPASSPALDAFRRLYAGAAQRAELLRFGDRRFGGEAGIRELLHSGFDQPRFIALHSARDYTPSQLWAWMSDMYDTGLLKPAALETFHRAYLEALQPLCGASGTLRWDDRYLLFTTTKADP